MSLKVTHEMHERRFGRNVGLAVVLVGLIGVVFGLTVVKVTNGDFEAVPQTQASQTQEGG